MQQPCLTKYITSGGIAGCNSLDVTCICSNQSFLGDVACCLAASCDAADQQSATTFADQLCKANGVTVPTAVSCTSTAASTGTSAGSQSSTSASVAAPTSSTPSTTSSSATTKSTSNASPQNVAGLGVGILGGLAAAAALL
jgi:hypothetical protein